MKQTFTAVVKQDGDWWIGWIEEVPGVNARKQLAKNFWRHCASPSERLSSSIARKLEARPERGTKSSRSPYEATRPRGALDLEWVQFAS